jgi:hypothetical protein
LRVASPFCLLYCIEAEPIRFLWLPMEGCEPDGADSSALIDCGLWFIIIIRSSLGL